MSLHACPRCGVLYNMAHSCSLVTQLPVLASNAPLPIGMVVGARFRIRGIEHRSTMSTVYRATDDRHGGTVVALKEFSAEGLADGERGEALVWLTREASLLSTLDHPRLPRLLAAFSEGDRHYLAMPFLAGETLEELVAHSGPRDEREVLRWGLQLAELLAYLHNQDPPVVHRDLKPANILLQSDSTLTLLDLGVARPLVRHATGTAIGTPGYAPPEQYQGLADERSDLYALGATLHRLLTGYDAEHEEPFRHPPIRELNPTVSQPTALLVAHLLQIVPEARPASARATVAEIEHTMHDIEARATYPIHVMYGQMLSMLAIATLMGIMIYATPFGDGAALGLPLAIAPGLLCFLPLLSPQLGRAIAQRPDLAAHRRRAGQVLLRGYILLLVLHGSFSAWLVPLIAVVLLARWLMESYRATDPARFAQGVKRIAP